MKGRLSKSGRVYTQKMEKEVICKINDVIVYDLSEDKHKCYEFNGTSCNGADFLWVIKEAQKHFGTKELTITYPNIKSEYLDTSVEGIMPVLCQEIIFS